MAAVWICVSVFIMSHLTSAGDDLEPGLSGAGHKEPRADNQPTHRCRPLHVVQHWRKPLGHILQGQDHPAHRVSLRKPAAGSASVNTALRGPSCVFQFLHLWRKSICIIHFLIHSKRIFWIEATSLSISNIYLCVRLQSRSSSTTQPKLTPLSRT